MYLGWYGFGRMLIEGLRTDSLYLFSTGIRVSQLVAAVSFVTAAVILILNRTVIKHGPDDMYVYRLLRSADGADDIGPDGPSDGQKEEKN